MYGDIFTEEDRSVERVLGALVSDAVPLTQRLVADVEGHLAKGELSLIVARSSRVGRVGHLLLSRVEPGTGCLTSLQVSMGARGLGVERLLLGAAETSVDFDRKGRTAVGAQPRMEKASGTGSAGQPL